MGSYLPLVCFPRYYPQSGFGIDAKGKTGPSRAKHHAGSAVESAAFYHSTYAGHKSDSGHSLGKHGGSGCGLATEESGGQRTFSGVARGDRWRSPFVVVLRRPIGPQLHLRGLRGLCGFGPFSTAFFILDLLKPSLQDGDIRHPTAQETLAQSAYLACGRGLGQCTGPGASP